MRLEIKEDEGEDEEEEEVEEEEEEEDEEGEGERGAAQASTASPCKRLPVSPTLMYAYASCHSICRRHQQCNSGREQDKREASGIGEQAQTPAPAFNAKLSLA